MCCHLVLTAVVLGLLSLPIHAKDRSEGSKNSQKSEGSSSKGEKSSEKEDSSSKSEHSSEKEDSSSENEHSNKEGSENDSGSHDESRNSDRSHNRDSDGRGSNHSNRESEHGDDAPKTVMEMLRRMTTPDKPKSGRSGAIDAPDIPHANNEIIAVNLSSAGAAHAQKLGFQVRGSVKMSHLGGHVTTLVPPRGMSAGHARDLMQRGPGGERGPGGRPNETISVNQRYSLYQLARKEMSGENEQSEPARRRLDCESDKCFGLKIVGWHDSARSCAQGVRIGVIDTAVDAHHPSFSSAQIRLGEFLHNGERPAPAWHGTGVLGVLAGNAASGTPGLMPKGEFYVANVFFEDANGEVVTDTFNVLSALEWMDALEVKVINMSFSGPRDQLVEKAIETMHKKGVVFAAAVGNDGPSSVPSYPAAYGPVIAVTAVNQEMRNYPYANRGDNVDIAAPGVHIWSAVPNAREGYHTGTSFAVPFVTASLAAIYNSAGQLDKKTLLDRLGVIDLGAKGQDPIYGRGLLVAPASCNGNTSVISQNSDEYRGNTTASQTTAKAPMRPSAGR